MSSELKTNKISPATGTTTTLGDASDVFQLPASAEIDIASGATLDINGTVDFAGATVSNLSAGKLLQVQYTAYAVQASNHNSSSWNTTGSMSVSITPSSASNMILVMTNDSFYLAGNGASNTSANAAIFETGSGTMVAFQFLGHNGAHASHDPCSMIGIYDPSDTSALTFQTKSYNGGAYYCQPRTNAGQPSGDIYYIIAMEYEV